MRVVIALGGNALIRRGEKAEASTQMKNIDIACKSISEIAKEHQVVLTHGNGPQVGLLALQADSYKDVTPYPLDVLGAETQGMIGYMLDQSLENLMPNQKIAIILTQIEVDPNDNAFKNPTKPIGPVYDQATAEKLAADRGWTIAPDGNYFRRVVPSPEPMEIVEKRSINLLVENDVLVVCNGGGGIPVMKQNDGKLKGIEAVIDKDRAAALLAKEVKADALVILTDAEAVATDWGKPDSKNIKTASPEDMKQWKFPAGSMGPKVDACCAYAKANPKGIACIGRLEDALDILAGKKGTIIKSDAKLTYY
ncbi:MAG: carbamate kinase [Alphaproteobacteria bacterium]